MAHYELTKDGELAAMPEPKCKAGDFVIWLDLLLKTYRIGHVHEVITNVVILDTGEPKKTFQVWTDNIVKVLA